MGDCQNYGPFLGPYYNTGPNMGPNFGNPKRDHNFDNPPSIKVPTVPKPESRVSQHRDPSLSVSLDTWQLMRRIPPPSNRLYGLGFHRNIRGPCYK